MGRVSARLPVIKALRQGQGSAAPDFSPFRGVSAFLLDSALSGQYGGSGMTGNWHAARTAALIASAPAKQTVQGFTETAVGDLYPVPLGGFNLDLAARLELILRADRAAREQRFLPLSDAQGANWLRRPYRSEEPRLNSSHEIPSRMPSSA